MKYVAFSSLYLVALFGISRYLFEPMYLYYELPWLDIPMHVLGGFGVASLAVALLLLRKKRITIMPVLVSFFVIAVAWEVYEYSLDVQAFRPWIGWTDTTSDIINGLIGALVAYGIARK